MKPYPNSNKVQFSEINKIAFRRSTKIRTFLFRPSFWSFMKPSAQISAMPDASQSFELLYNENEQQWKCQNEVFVSSFAPAPSSLWPARDNGEWRDGFFMSKFCILQPSALATLVLNSIQKLAHPDTQIAFRNNVKEVNIVSAQADEATVAIVRFCAELE